MAGSWKRLKDGARRCWSRRRPVPDPVREARDKQFAEWIAREHKDDPIHK